MNAEAAEKRAWTPAEYVAWERRQPTRHQYFRGEIFDMAGASREHNLLVGNVVRLIGNALVDRPCEAYPSDMRVHVPETDLYTYPDASVVCGAPVFEDDAFDTLLNPTAIIDVLSDSTEAYDRGKKAESYRKIASLRHYLLVAQDRVFVEHYQRSGGGDWLFREYGAGGRVELVGIHCTLVVDEIYLKVFARA